MLADSQHPNAIDALRADAETIRRELKFEPGQTKPTVPQHEQFAKWTEQFLREGVAPSAGLARVFAQFKTWLMELDRQWDEETAAAGRAVGKKGVPDD